MMITLTITMIRTEIMTTISEDLGVVSNVKLHELRCKVMEGVKRWELVLKQGLMSKMNK